MRRILDRLVNGLAVVFNEAPIVAKVGSDIVVNQLAACERDAHVYDRGKLFDFDIDRFRRIPCLLKRLRDDRGNRVADMPDFALGKHRVGRLLHRLSIAVRNQPAAGKPPDAFEVLAREDGQNSRHCFRFRRVDRLQRAVRDFRSQKIGMGLAADVEIVRVPPVSSQETHVFAALAASADTAIFRHVSSVHLSLASSPIEQPLPPEWLSRCCGSRCSGKCCLRGNPGFPLRRDRGFSFRSAAADMTIPGVQKPH